MIKRFSLFITLLLAVSLTYAASMSMAVIGGGFAKVSGTYSVKGATATAANGAFVTPATVVASGKLVTMPASALIAANVAPYAITAMRLNPAGLVVGLAASWLLSKGLTYANEQWNQSVSTSSGVPASSYSIYGLTNYCPGLGERACADRYMTVAMAKNIDGATVSGPVFLAGYGMRYSYIKNPEYNVIVTVTHVCPAGTIDANGVCTGVVDSTSPATEDDFTAAGSGVLPDDVAQELARKDVPIPVDAPALSPTTVPDGEPYLDPLTGRMVQRQIEVRPSPTAENPERVEVTEYTRDAGDVPGQTAEPVAATKEIVFPSDYARQGEAQQAADSINVRLNKMLEASPAPVDPTVPDSGYTDFGTTFQSLLGWQLPGHTSQCPTASFNTPWNTAYTIDSHCQLITNHWSALQAAMAVVWTIIALFIVLRA